MRWNRGLFWEGAQLNNTVCWIKKSFTLKTLAFFKELLHICISKDKICFHSNHPILLFHAGQSTCTETKKELRDNLLRYLWLWEGWGNILVTLRVDTETYCHPHSRNLGHISSPPLAIAPSSKHHAPWFEWVMFILRRQKMNFRSRGYGELGFISFLKF